MSRIKGDEAKVGFVKLELETVLVSQLDYMLGRGVTRDHAR
jgi:hypothetical protein